MSSNSNDSTYRTIGPLGFDEVFKQDVLQEIYDLWYEENNKNNWNPVIKETIAAWSMRLKEHGFNFTMYIRDPGPLVNSSDIPNDFIQFGMPFGTAPQRRRTKVSMVNLREELFFPYRERFDPVMYAGSPLSHILKMLMMYGPHADNISISYVLPTAKELYGIPSIKDNVVSTTEPAGEGQYRTHTKFVDEESNASEPMNNDEPNDIEEADNYDLEEDICYGNWEIIKENVTKNTALVMRHLDSSNFKKGQTIEPGSLYHRPLFYSDRHSGYWINQDSELYRLIKRSIQPSTERNKAITKVRYQPVGLSDEERAERKLLDDIIHWRVRNLDDDSLIVRPVEGSLFFRRNRPFETIETGTLYHRPLVYAHKYGGYWIHRDCELARLILRNHNLYK